MSGFEILNRGGDSDALGEYPYQVLARVRNKWHAQILNLKKSMGRKFGITVIGFEINNDGSLGKVIPVESTGDDSLDMRLHKQFFRLHPFRTCLVLTTRKC